MAGGASIKVRRASGTISTGQDFLDIDSSGGGRLQFVLLQLSAPHASGAEGIHARRSFGVLARTGESTATARVVCGQTEDSVNPDNANHRGHASAVALQLSTSGAAVADEALFLSFHTDGVRIEANGGSNWTVAYAWQALLIFADDDDIAVEVGDDVSDSGGDTAKTFTLATSYDERPELLYLLSNNSALDEVTRTDDQISQGWGYDDGGSIATISEGSFVRNGTGNEYKRSQFDNTGDRILHFPHTATAFSALELTATAVESFELTTRDNPGSHSFIYAAISFKGNLNLAVDRFDLTSGLGVKVNAVPGFACQAFVQYFGLGTTTNVNSGGNAGNLFGTWTTGIADETNEGCEAQREQNANGGDSANYGSTAKVFTCRKHSGAIDLEGNVDSFTANGWDLEVTNQVGQIKPTTFVAFGVAPAGAEQNPTPSVLPLAAPAVSLDLPTEQNPTATQVPLAAPAVTIDIPTEQNPTATQVPLAAPAVTVDLETEQNPTPSVLPLAAPAVSLDLPRAQDPTPSVLPLAAPAVSLDLPRAQDPTPSLVPLAAPPVTVELGSAQNPTPSVLPLAAPAVTLDLPREQNPTPSLVPLAAPPVTVALGSEQNPTPSVLPLGAPAVTLDLPREQNPTPSLVPLFAPVVRTFLPTDQFPTPSVLPLAAPPVTVAAGSEQNPTASQVPLGAPAVTLDLPRAQDPTPSVVPLFAPPVTVALGTEQNPTPSVLPLAAPAVSVDLATEQNPTPLQVPLFAPPVTVELGTGQNPTPSVVPLFAPAVSLDLPLGLNPSPSVIPLFAPPVLRFAGAPTVILTLDLEVVSVLTLDLEAPGVLTLDLEA